MSTYSNGREREYRTRDAFTAKGWTHVMRASSSKGSADLLMAHPEHGAALIQVGGKSKTLGPAARERLCRDAELCGALALLVVYTPRMTVWRVTEEVPSKWERWS